MPSWQHFSPMYTVSTFTGIDTSGNGPKTENSKTHASGKRGGNGLQTKDSKIYTSGNSGGFVALLDEAENIW